jgi:hypothetical protein
MITAAQQYRDLVAKLESINPSTSVNEENEVPNMAAGMDTAEQPASAPVGGSVDPDKYKPNDNIPVIKAGTLAQAKVVALKQLGPGKKFRFCMTYGTKLGPAKPPQGGMEKPQDNFSKLGGVNVVKPAPTYSGITDKPVGKR